MRILLQQYAYYKLLYAKVTSRDVRYLYFTDPFQGSCFANLGVWIQLPPTSVPKSTQVWMQPRLLQPYLKVHLFAVCCEYILRHIWRNHAHLWVRL